MRAASLVLGVLVSGCLTEPVDERGGGAPIIGGTMTIGDPAVGRVAIGNDTCTGTLVAPNVVLTAKHCFAPGTRPEQVSFRTGLFGDEPGASVIAFTYRGPMDGKVTTQDILALTLDHALSVDPVAVRRGPMSALDLGATVRLVGYGVTDPSDAVDPVKREGTSTITRMSDEYFVTASEVSNCWGDSGGPVLMGAVLVGVISGTYDRGCTRRGSHIRIDRNLALIDEASVKTAGGGGDGGAGGQRLPGRGTSASGGGDDTCTWALDGVCDEPSYCDTGTDATDCADQELEQEQEEPDAYEEEPAACADDECLDGDGWCDEGLDCCAWDADCEVPEDEGDACQCDDACVAFEDCCDDC